MNKLAIKKLILTQEFIDVCAIVFFIVPIISMMIVGMPRLHAWFPKYFLVNLISMIATYYVIELLIFTFISITLMYSRRINAENNLQHS
jgi:hypothetical protein